MSTGKQDEMKPMSSFGYVTEVLIDLYIGYSFYNPTTTKDKYFFLGAGKYSNCKAGTASIWDQFNRYYTKAETPEMKKFKETYNSNKIIPHLRCSGKYKDIIIAQTENSMKLFAFAQPKQA